MSARTFRFRLGSSNVMLPGSLNSLSKLKFPRFDGDFFTDEGERFHAGNEEPVTYAQLAEMIGDKEPNVRNKLSRGKFSAAYMLQCLDSLDLQSLRLD